MLIGGLTSVSPEEGQIRDGFTFFVSLVLYSEVNDMKAAGKSAREEKFFEGIPHGLNYNRLLLAYLIYVWLDKWGGAPRRGIIEAMREDGLDIDSFVEDQWFGGMSIRAMQQFYSSRRGPIRDILKARGHDIKHGHHVYLPSIKTVKRIVREAGSYRAAGKKLGVTGQTVKANIERARTCGNCGHSMRRRPKPQKRKVCGSKARNYVKTTSIEAFDTYAKSIHISQLDCKRIVEFLQWQWARKALLGQATDLETQWEQSFEHDLRCNRPFSRRRRKLTVPIPFCSVDDR